MNLYVSVSNCMRCYDLMMRLREYDATVKDGDGIAYVKAHGLTMREYEEVMAICAEHGEVGILDEI